MWFDPIIFHGLLEILLWVLLVAVIATAIVLAVFSLKDTV